MHPSALSHAANHAASTSDIMYLGYHTGRAAMVKDVKCFGNLYLANRMSGLPFFNAPWFDATAALLYEVPGVDFVFNPADEDRQRGFEPMLCPNGTMDEAIAAGFVARDALGADWAYIAHHSNGLIIGPDWAKSPGTISEIACHQALHLPVWESKHFFQGLKFRAAADMFDPDWQFPPLSNYLV